MKTLVSLLLLCFCFILLTFASAIAQKTISTDIKNSVSIQQIGNNNIRSADIFTEKNSVALFEISVKNSSNLNIAAFEAKGALVKAGITTSFFQKNRPYTKNIQTVVLQQGNNQNLLMLESNGDLDTMKIAMKANHQNTAIRNFKRQR
ncbi:hypothetical protein [Rasiella sp. SM2506]|uniref:hypothetical protein n=1 Tax=Rasiella sp. SM2506 TaxID=3423914 RepID=UPI003D7B47AF